MTSAGEAAAGGRSPSPVGVRRRQSGRHPAQGERGLGGLEEPAGRLQRTTGPPAGHRGQVPLLQPGEGPHAVDGGRDPAHRGPGEPQVGSAPHQVDVHLM